MKKIALLLSIFSLVGCTSAYKCELGRECTDSLEVLGAARENGGTSESVIRVPDEYPELYPEEESNADYQSTEDPIEELGVVSRFGNGNYRSKPVYIPDAPMRIWVAPTKVGSILVGDYEMFTVIPGGYMSGVNGSGLNSKNSHINGIYGPLDERKDPGFQPVPVEAKQQKIRPY